MKNNGFTLIEVLVATFIIATVVVAVSRLLGSAEYITGLGRETFVATNVAREGLELVRAVRDTNWFTNDDRALWLDRGICRSGPTTYSDTDRQFVIEPATVRNSDEVKTGSGALYINPLNHEWTHEVTDKPTPYSRLISVDCSQVESEVAKVTITAKVTWRSRNQDREAIIKEALYNWLPAQRKINP